MVYPGRPLVILESKTVKARLVGDTSASYSYVKQDIGGWYVMPKAHYERLAKAAGIIGNEVGTK